MAPKKKVAKAETPPKKYNLRGKNPAEKEIKVAKTTSQPTVRVDAPLLAAKTASAPVVSKESTKTNRKMDETKRNCERLANRQEENRKRRSATPEEVSSGDESHGSDTSSDQLDNSALSTSLIQTATVAAEATERPANPRPDYLMDKENAQLEGEMDKVLEKVDVLSEQMISLETMLNLTNAAMTSISAKVDFVIEKMEKEAQLRNISDMAAAAVIQNATVAVEEAKSKEMEEKLNFVLEKVKLATDTVTQLAEKVELLAEKVEHQTKENLELRDRVDKLAPVVEMNSASVDKNTELLEKNARNVNYSVEMLVEKMAEDKIAQQKIEATVTAAISEFKEKMARETRKEAVPLEIRNLIQEDEITAAVEMTPLPDTTDAIDTSSGPVPVGYAKPFATLEIETPKVWRKTKTRSGMMDTSRIPSPVYGSDEQSEGEETKENDNLVFLDVKQESAETAEPIKKNTVMANDDEVAHADKIRQKGNLKTANGQTNERQSGKVSFADLTPIEQNKNTSSYDTPAEPDRTKRVPLICHKDSVKINRKRTGSSIGTECVTTQNMTAESIGPVVKFKRPLQPGDLLSSSPVFDSEGNFIPTSQRASYIRTTKSAPSEESDEPTEGDKQDTTKSSSSFVNDGSSFTIGNTEDLGGTLLVERTINITESNMHESFVDQSGSSKGNAKFERSIVCLDKTNMSPSSKTIDLVTDGISTPYAPK